MEESLRKLQQHCNDRDAFYKKLKPFWYDLAGEAYALYDIYVTSSEEVKELREIAQRIVAIYDKTAGLLRMVDDKTLLSLGYPKATLPFVRARALPIEGIIRRLDMVKTKEGWKHVELNADTPTFIMECHHVNGVVCEQFQYKDPNAFGMIQLQKSIHKAVKDLTASIENPKIVFTAHDDHEEDWYTTCFLAEMYGESCEVIPLRELRIIEKVGLFTPTGEKIDLLYRQTYPIEHLVHDVDETSKTNIGIELLRLVSEKKLQLLNPLSSFLLQSKGVQALIWGLHEEKNTYFTEDEHVTIEKYFLPTYLEADTFIERKEEYVQKPCFGREGDSILLYNSNGEIVETNKQQNYNKETMVYQKLVELPKVTVKSPKGVETLHMLFGVFVIGTKAGAIGIRAGNKITGNESYFLPLGINFSNT